MTKSMAAVTYCVKLCLLGGALKEAGSDLEKVDEQLEESCKTWLVNRSRGPMGAIDLLRLYLASVDKDVLAQKFTTWSDDGKWATYKDKLLDMDRWRAMIQELMGEITITLEKHLLMDLPNQPSLDVHGLRDNLPNDVPGFSFLSDPRNHLDQHETWLHEAVKQAGRLAAFRLEPGWNETAIQEYVWWMTRFREQLLVLVHLTSGLPARGPEILGTRYRNSDTARHVLIDHDGLVMILLWYHKMQYRVGARPVCRFLCPALGQLLVRFLVLVLPFGKFLRSRRGDQVKEGTYLFTSNEQQAWETERLSRLLKTSFQRRVGVSMDVSSWRHLAVAIDRRFLQAAAAKMEDDGGDEGEEEDEVHHLQASHTAAVGNAAYGNSINLSEGLSDEARQQYRRVSMQWWGLCGLGGGKGHKRGATLTPLESVLARRPKQAHAWDDGHVQRALRKLYGAHARTKSDHQRQALMAVAEGVAQLVVILPTGAGTSMSRAAMCCAWKTGC